VSTAAYVVLVDTGAVPQAPTLSAVVVASDTIRWAWTENGGAAASFGLCYATGSLLASLPAGASFFMETGLSTNTAMALSVAQRPSGQAQSKTVTVRTPDLRPVVPGTSSGTLSGVACGTAVCGTLQIPNALLGAATSWLVSVDPVNNPLTDKAKALIASAQASPPAGTSGSPLSSPSSSWPSTTCAPPAPLLSR